MGPYLIMVLTLTISNVKTTTVRNGTKMPKYTKEKSCVPPHIWRGGQGKEKTKFVTRIGSADVQKCTRTDVLPFMWWHQPFLTRH